MSLPRYSEYRSSEIPWIKQVPAHWGELRTKFLFELMKRPPSEDDGVVTAFRDGQVTLRSKRRTEGFTNSLKEIGYQGVRKGDLVIHAMDAFAGAIGVSDSDGKSTPVYSVCKPREGLSNSKYYARLLRQMALSGFVESLAKGIRERSTEFRWADAGNVSLPVPPLSEQFAIAAFLDRETAKIDALISEQEKLIALLAEKRQATISHAVTKGLNPDATMKDSGVPWLGEVPAHWALPPLYLRYRAELGKMLDASRIKGQHSVPYLRNVDVQWDSINLDDLPCMDIEVGEYARYTVRDGDLLVCEGGEVGRAAVAQAVDTVIGYQKALHRLRAISDDEHPRYMFYTFAWAARAGAFAGEGHSTIAHLTGEQLRKCRFPKPPDDEQMAIASFLDAETARLNGLETAATHAVDLLKERRSALIAAAVTGRIDVRALAA